MPDNAPSTLLLLPCWSAGVRREAAASVCDQRLLGDLPLLLFACC
jgi:hypothetical protein